LPNSNRLVLVENVSEVCRMFWSDRIGYNPRFKSWEQIGVAGNATLRFLLEENWKHCLGGRVSIRSWLRPVCYGFI